MVAREQSVRNADKPLSGIDRLAEICPACVTWRLVVPGFVRWFLPFAFAILVIGYFMASAELTHQQVLRDTKAEERVALAAKDIELQFKAIVADLKYLTTATSLQRFIDGAPGSRRTLANDLRNFAVSAGLYDQIRFIDRDGQEQVRVDLVGGVARIAAPEELQNKKHRYYFTDTLKLARGNIFVSPLDLNVEHGQVERPYKPTVRFGIPVFSNGGDKVGVIILNYLAKNSLDNFQTMFARDDGQLYLLNSDGYFLSSPDASETWGFMLKERRDERLATRFPALWERLKTSYAGSIESAGTRFVYAQIHPLWDGLHSSSGGPNIFGRSAKHVPTGEYYWTIAAAYPPLALSDIVAKPSLAWFIIVALATAAISAWFVARDAQHERARIKQLHQYREHLEQQVVTRTEELQTSSTKLELLLDSTAEGIIGIDTDGQCVFANHTGYSLLGYLNESEILGKDLQTHIGFPEHGDFDFLNRIVRTGKGLHIDDGFITTTEGETRPVDIRMQPMLQDGTVSGLVVSFVDISASKDAQQRIHTLSQAVEQSPVSVMITNPQGEIEFVNEKFESVTGYPFSEVIGKNPHFLRSSEDMPETEDELRNVLSAGESWHGEMQNQRRDGTPYWVRTHIAPVYDERDNLRHLLRIDEDITQYKEQEQKIVQQAHYDFLTDLPNRLLAMDRLGQLIKKASRDSDHVIVMFLDMDDFKKINDTFGHDTGDQLLIEAARRLQSTVREQDTVSRLGGDEFLVILGNSTPASTATTIAEHLLDTFRAPFLIGGQEIVVTVSIGIALFPHDGETTSSLLRSADIAMYQAKHTGSNTYQYFASTMNQEIKRRLHLEARLRHALKRGDIQVHYQPIIRLEDNDLIGAEALIRWHDEELGQVPPDEFIPVAEQTGVIEELGAFVLDQALAECKKFRERFNPNFRVSVNASPSQFRDRDFPLYVEAALGRARLPPSALVLEVTEGVLLSGYQQVDEILNRLHRLEVKLALDDFGTGYASLSYLRHYPFDILKIDREFVRDMTTDKNDRELVRATLQMATALELQVVAEGVEELEHVHMLREWQCCYAQGYYFGKPCAPTSFDRPSVTL